MVHTRFLNNFYLAKIKPFIQGIYQQVAWKGVKTSKQQPRGKFWRKQDYRLNVHH